MMMCVKRKYSRQWHFVLKSVHDWLFMNYHGAVEQEGCDN